MPTKNLPLTRPLRDIGVPDSLVDKADQFPRPIVDAGYRRHERPGDSRPCLSEGRIRRNVQSVQTAREQRRDQSQSRHEQTEDSRQQGQAGADEGLDRSDPAIEESSNDVAPLESDDDSAVGQAEQHADSE